jgi:aspartate aminotransferase
MLLARRVNVLKPSITLSITARANALKSQGVDLIGYGAGEPDFDTPVQIKKAAIAAIEKGLTKYTASAGILPLREEICKKLSQDNALAYKPEQVIVGTGAKYVIFEVICGIVDEGDEVIVPAPYWVSYPEMVAFAGGKSVFIDTTKTDFKVTPEALRAAITPKTKAVFLNYPSNPTGATYTKEELRALADVIVEKGIWCISDEIYEKLIYDGKKHVSIASFSQAIYDRTFVVNGMSKSFAMTGWRVGYVAGPSVPMKAISMLQDHSTSNTCTVAQYAALEGLKLENSKDAEFTATIDGMVAAFVDRRDAMTERLNTIPGFSCKKPDGAFYCFPDISALIGRSYEGTLIKGSMDLAEALLAHAQVAIVPGIAFGADRCVRFSYAMNKQEMLRGLDRIERFVRALR